MLSQHHSTIHFTLGSSSVSGVLVAQSTQGICAILLGEDKEELIANLQTRFPTMTLAADESKLKPALASVIDFIETPQEQFHLPLDMQGTVFQKRVWQALQSIPLGVRVSYSDIAKLISAPKAVRAIAQACGANPVAVVVPCHRVVRKNGALSGYRWGVAIKQKLLDRESR